jgi:hypothetical protein
MMTGCEATETAVRLCLHLHARLIPEDFHPAGEYLQVMAQVVDEYTNYDALRDDLPGCPADCPIAASAGEPSGAGCFNYNLARDILVTEGRRDALVMYALCQPWPRTTG